MGLVSLKPWRKQPDSLHDFSLHINEKKTPQKDNLATSRLSFLSIKYWHHYTRLNSSLTFSVISIPIGKLDEDSDGILIQFWISLYVDEDGALGRLHEESEELFCGGLYYESLL